MDSGKLYRLCQKAIYSINSLRLSGSSARQDLLQAQQAKYPNLTGSVSRSGCSNNGLQFTGVPSEYRSKLINDHLS
jgi:hypothetical protein